MSTLAPGRRSTRPLAAFLCGILAAGVLGCDNRPASATAGVQMRPQPLAQLIDRSDKVVVLTGPRSDAKVLYESSERRDLD